MGLAAAWICFKEITVIASQNGRDNQPRCIHTPPRGGRLNMQAS